jgi:putative FmdB family regulatory protein
MPIYEYRCRKCGAEFETLVRNADDAKELTCPSCGAADAQKRMSVFTGTVAAAGTSACADASGGGSCAAGGSCNPRGGFS